MAIQIRPVESDTDRLTSYRLRYQVLVEELGRNHPHFDHEHRTVCDPCDSSGHTFVAEDAGQIVGTIRINFRDEGPLDGEEMFGVEEFQALPQSALSSTGRLAVLPSHRSTSVAARLALKCYEAGTAHGVQIDFILTRPHLVRMYQQMGYRLYRPTVRRTGYAAVVPMLLLAADRAHFEKIRSPMRRLAQGCVLPTAAVELFHQRFPAYASLLPTFGYETEELWEHLFAKMDVPPDQLLQLMTNFSTEETQAILTHLDVMDYLPGDLVFRQGDEGNSMFCLLAGQVEVVRDKDGSQQSVNILNAGDVFGEMGFVAKSRRNATVVVREPSRILVFSEAEFKKFSTNNPELALKLLTNLFKVVVGRFNQTL